MKIRIRSSALLLSLHNPVRLAEDVATIDVLSSGWSGFWHFTRSDARYAEGYGVRIQDGMERFRELFQFIIEWWTKDSMLAARIFCPPISAPTIVPGARAFFALATWSFKETLLSTRLTQGSSSMK